VIGGPDAQQLVLEFPRKSASGKPLDSLQQIIGCYWRKAYFGGRHLMFVCSECRRSARVLYALYANHRIWFFSCRKCAGITYQSTMGHRWDRSARRVENCALGSNGEGAAPCACQAASHARADVPAHFGDACLPRNPAKAGCELPSKIQAGSTECLVVSQFE
jgi:hypothetical protein